MIKRDVATLSGTELDYAVAQITGMLRMVRGTMAEQLGGYSPATKWQHGGPIIATETIAVQPEWAAKGLTVWRAKKHDSHGVFLPGHVGATPLGAAMRCFVFRKFGAEVDM